MGDDLPLQGHIMLATGSSFFDTMNHKAKVKVVELFLPRAINCSFKDCFDRVGIVTRAKCAFSLVPDGEHPADNRIFASPDCGVAHNGPDPVVDPKPSFVPSVEA